ASEKGDIIAFGRHFLANPRLSHRLQHDMSFNQYDSSTFYVQGGMDLKGYTDYPF
ncbi:hypothetical protein K435DRAFT_620372, partial [Dendrothele bispora CBS 962.96]